MIRVDQTTFGAQGNCFSACIASILELPLVDVPYFMGDPPDDEWWGRTIAWLADRGLDASYYKFDMRDPDAPPGYTIVSGRSPRHATRLHACVARDGVLVHDPNPRRHGLRSITDYIVIHGPDRMPMWFNRLDEKLYNESTRERGIRGAFVGKQIEIGATRWR